MLAQMGGLAEQQLDDAIDALSRRDTALADRVIQNDETIDVLEHQIEEKAILTIAKRQPMARDLREIMVAIRVASDLERIGDLAKNTAKRTHAISEASAAQADDGRHPHGPARPGGAQEHSRRLCRAPMPTRRSRSGARDEELDALYNSIFRELLTYMMEDPRNISLCTHLLFGAKNMERIGDHATNIAENIYYLVHGKTAGRGPAKEGFNQHAVPAQSQRRRLTAMSASILVVEDEEPIQILLSYNLESEGYRVRHTAQGEDVPRLVSEERPT